MHAYYVLYGKIEQREKTGIFLGKVQIFTCSQQKQVKGKGKMKKWSAFIISVILLTLLVSCSGTTGANVTAGQEAAPAVSDESDGGTKEAGPESGAPDAGLEGGTAEAGPGEASSETEMQSAADTAAPAPAEKNGDVIILFTSDIHCGVDDGFGFVGLQQMRDSLEARGFTTLLVDDGDAIQGEIMGILTKGEAMIDLMNSLKYDAAIPGNHEFDYGSERFLELTEKAEFPFISCNLNKDGELLLPPYVMKEAAGMRIAFVGVTTPLTMIASAPKHFQDENGEYIYDFSQDSSGEKLYTAVQKAVDDARAEGADYVYVMGHLGLLESCRPWTYADVISHTNGIDVFLDGHSHDTEQVVMKNKDGEDVVRAGCGTKLSCIGYSLISAQDGIRETNVWSWPNKEPMPDLLGIRNSMSDQLDAVDRKIREYTEKVIAKSDVLLTVYDPEEKDGFGNPIYVIRSAETNLGDFITDAMRVQTGADLAICGGGAIRAEIDKGDVTYGTILQVFPFQNQICVIKLTGQQILDALEWGSKALPDGSGSFFHVSGLTYEVDVSVPSGCRKDENGFMSGIEGERRVRNVIVGGEPIDPEKTYTMAGNEFNLMNNGDGLTAFDGAEVINDQFKLDSQLLSDYIVDDLGGVIGEEYADPYGQGRITIVE